jgi:hypothetical protein
MEEEHDVLKKDVTRRLEEMEVACVRDMEEDRDAGWQVVKLVMSAAQVSV